MNVREPDLSEDAPWRERYRAWGIAGAGLAEANPARGLVATNQSGTWQLHAWDPATGELRQLTSRPTGVPSGFLDARGRFVAYMEDTGGNELGHVVRVPWEGGAAVDLTPGLPPYALTGMAGSRDGSVLAMTTAGADGFAVRVAELDDSGTPGAWREVARAPAMFAGPILSPDGRYLAVHTNEHSGTTDFSILLFDVAGGVRIGELFDEGARIGATEFSPVAGRHLLAGSSDAGGQERPFIYDLATGERRTLETGGIEGDVGAAGFSPAGDELLLMQTWQARAKLFAHEIGGGNTRPLDPGGNMLGGWYASDGRLFARVEEATAPGRVVALDPTSGAIVSEVLRGGDAPAGRPWRSVTFASSGGATIQGWLCTPEGEGPWPAILEMHGGPTAVEVERFSPPAQAWVDHGFAYLTINYRGSMTFGKEFESVIRGNVGMAESDDVAAACRWLVAQGIADPARVLLTGWSYGGYLTLLCLGTHPELYAGGMAGIAIADWAVMHEDENPFLRQFQEGLFGGSPAEKPEEHRRSSPITYAERVRAPVLVIQGRNDTRCPARQMQMYEERMLEMGKAITVEWFEAGHGMRVTEEQVAFKEKMLTFACRVAGA